jgi:hypothetical protein
VPYFISNSTILQYEKHESKEKLSLTDIISTCFASKKMHIRLYFKVIPFNHQEESDSEKQETHTRKRSNMDETTISQFYDSTKHKQMVESDLQYFEIEFKTVNVDGDTSYLIMIKDISSIIKSQQKLSDDMYQDAIESNYSHE